MVHLNCKFYTEVAHMDVQFGKKYPLIEVVIAVTIILTYNTVIIYLKVIKIFKHSIIG